MNISSSYVEFLCFETKARKSWICCHWTWPINRPTNSTTKIGLNPVSSRMVRPLERECGAKRGEKMSPCKTLIRSSLPFYPQSFSLLSPRPSNYSILSYPLHPFGVRTRHYASIGAAAIPVENTGIVEDSPENPITDTVEQLLANRDDVARLMKMERRCSANDDSGEKTADLSMKRRWFPYLDRFRCGSSCLSSCEVLEAVEPVIMDVRKERFRSVVRNRTYSVCLVVEGLSDFGNVSAVFRSADALGFQSVHVVSCDSTKRCNAI